MSPKPHKINERNNFIGGWYLDDLSICDELISYHMNSSDKREGMMTGGPIGFVDKTAKDSTDVTLSPCDLTQRYVVLLYEVAKHYVQKYSYSGKLVPWGVLEPIAIQRYVPGGGYKIWHFERENLDDVNARRHLAFMTYLNDVQDGGGTAFYYQDVVIKPEKGLTLIWPSEWMFTHKGVVSETQEKYIVTGWFSTYTQEQFMAFQDRRGKAGRLM